MEYRKRRYRSQSLNQRRCLFTRGRNTVESDSNEVAQYSQLCEPVSLLEELKSLLYSNHQSKSNVPAKVVNIGEKDDISHISVEFGKIAHRNINIAVIGGYNRMFYIKL